VERRVQEGQSKLKTKQKTNRKTKQKAKQKTKEKRRGSNSKKRELWETSPFVPGSNPSDPTVIVFLVTKI